ncbi:transport protein particle component, partial [Piromyces finnis]
MSLYKTEKTQVCESCFDYIFMEMVHFFNNVDNTNEKEKELKNTKLEQMGYLTGQSLAERLTGDRARFTDNLDVIKFVCKDFWSTIFKKQVDNLKTNHKGTYVLTDNNFKWFSKMSINNNQEDFKKEVLPYLSFPCGIIRGVLSNLGINCTVLADVNPPNQC